MAKRPPHQARSSLFNHHPSTTPTTPASSSSNNNNSNNSNDSINKDSNNGNTNITINHHQLFLEQQNDATERSFSDYTSSLRKNVSSLKELVHYMNDDVLGDHSLLDHTNMHADSSRYSLKNSYKKLQEDVIQVKTYKQVLVLSLIIVMVFFIIYYGGRFFVFQVLLANNNNNSHGSYGGGGSVSGGGVSQVASAASNLSISAGQTKAR